MVFEKISIVKGKKYKSLVRGYRDENGKVRHKVIKYLGPVNPINRKRANPNAGRKPKLKARELKKEEKEFIQKALKNGKSFIKDRARIIQLSSEGNTVKQICGKLKFDRKKVETILRGFNKEGMKVFKRKKNIGRPRRITKEERTLIISYLNTHPEKLGLHYNNWSHKKISGYAKKQGIKVSPSQVGRIIRQDEIKYKKKLGRMYSNDPFFS